MFSFNNKITFNKTTLCNINKFKKMFYKKNMKRWIIYLNKQ